MDEAARKIVLCALERMPALCKGIIMAIFHHASVCPDHFPFNEKLFLFLFCYNRSVDSDCRRILGLQGYRVNLFHPILNIFLRDIAKSNLRRRICFFVPCMEINTLGKKVLSKIEARTDYWKILSGIIERCR